MVYDSDMAGSNVCGEYQGMYDNGWNNACQYRNSTETCDTLKDRLEAERLAPGSPSPP